jgi:methionine synthase II (cobalamin-independent)
MPIGQTPLAAYCVRRNCCRRARRMNEANSRASNCAKPKMPMRFMPWGKHVVLGLITTKTGVLEPAEEVRRRIDEAA